jgi:hypothetical protein
VKELDGRLRADESSLRQVDAKLAAQVARLRKDLNTRLEWVRSGFWADWGRARLERGGGPPEQYKHPCLIGDPQFRDGIRAGAPAHSGRA